VYDRLYGRSLTPDTIVDGLAEFFSAQLAPEQKRIVVRRFIDDVDQIRLALEDVESRMYSASLLFVYEGDSQALSEALDTEASANPVTIEEEQDEESDEEEDEEAVPKRATELKMIDFAHASWVSGQGRDENVLKGVYSVAKSLRALLEKYVS